MVNLLLILIGELSSAQAEMEEVRNQIVILGERLVEEQETNKKNQELAVSLECKSFPITSMEKSKVFLFSSN